MHPHRDHEVYWYIAQICMIIVFMVDTRLPLNPVMHAVGPDLPPRRLHVVCLHIGNDWFSNPDIVIKNGAAALSWP